MSKIIAAWAFLLKGLGLCKVFCRYAQIKIESQYNKSKGSCSGKMTALALSNRKETKTMEMVSIVGHALLTIGYALLTLSVIYPTVH